MFKKGTTTYTPQGPFVVGGGSPGFGTEISLGVGLKGSYKYCGWTKSCTTLKPCETIVRWYLQGFLDGAEWISSHPQYHVPFWGSSPPPFRQETIDGFDPPGSVNRQAGFQ